MCNKLLFSLRTKGEPCCTEAHYFTAFKHNPRLGKPSSWLMSDVKVCECSLYMRILGADNQGECYVELWGGNLKTLCTLHDCDQEETRRM